MPARGSPSWKYATASADACGPFETGGSTDSMQKPAPISLMRVRKKCNGLQRGWGFNWCRYLKGALALSREAKGASRACPVGRAVRDVEHCENGSCRGYGSIAWPIEDGTALLLNTWLVSQWPNGLMT